MKKKNLKNIEWKKTCSISHIDLHYTLYIRRETYYIVMIARAYRFLYVIRTTSAAAFITL